MDEKNQNGDIVELNLPDYTEEQNAVPDVETESSFAEDREEIFRRNMELAARSGEAPAYREEFPENPDAEEIYPQIRVMPEDNRPDITSALDASGKSAAKSSSKRKSRKWGRLETICASIVIAVVAVSAIVVISKGAAMSGGLSLTAEAVVDADEKAKLMHTAASAGLTQLFIEGADISGYKFENSGTVFSFGGTEINTADYLGNNFSGYVCGGFDSETGSVEYTLWSAEPIPDEYKRVLTDSEQEALAKEGIIIGCYPAFE
ncbi:MAG: hypothetical protein K2N60_10430 [Oscillospiraceae bacterium]|nr:hypothetical protein [Oscillospiraceae bacterium]